MMEQLRDKKNIAILFLLFIVIALLIVIIVLLKPTTTKCVQHTSATDTSKPNEKSALMCKNNKVTINPDIENQSNIFRELTLAEIKNIEKYIDENFGFNRSNFKNPIYNTISIQNVELYLPNKEDALSFLDKSGKQPERQARVTIVHYPFNVTYYLIGPLKNPNHHQLVKFSDRENPLNVFATGMYRLERACKLERFTTKVFTYMWPLMKDTFGDFEEYARPEDLFKAGLAPTCFAKTSNKENEMWGRIEWDFLKNSTSYIHVHKFSFISVFVNVTSKNESEWDIGGVSTTAQKTRVSYKFVIFTEPVLNGKLHYFVQCMYNNFFHTLKFMF